MISPPPPTPRCGLRRAVTAAIVASVAAVLLAGCDQEATSTSGARQPSYQQGWARLSAGRV